MLVWQSLGCQLHSNTVVASVTKDFKFVTVQLTSSCVRLGQSFKTVGYGCTSCWGDVGAGNVEADVIYITFIGVSNT